MGYEVFINGELLYDSLLVNETDMQIIDPVLSIDVEGGSFSFIVPTSHRLWGSYFSKFSDDSYLLFTRRTDTVVINKNGHWLWEGFISDFSSDLEGSYNVTCTGSLRYLENAKIPLRQVLNRVRSDSETKKEHFEKAYKIFISRILKHYNDRINEFSERYGVDLSYQKIYYSPAISKIEIPENIQVPWHFSRIVNFESCYDAIYNHFANDFKGFFYLTKSFAHILDPNVYGPTGSYPQDGSITNAITRDILIINFKCSYEVMDKLVVHTGNHLLDYNVSDSFDLVTSVVPRGAGYTERANDEDFSSKWWMRDDHAAFDNIDQYANLGWGLGEHYYINKNLLTQEPRGGTRIYIPKLASLEEVIKKYGYKEAIVDFGDDVVAKFPYDQANRPIGDKAYGYPLGDKSTSYLSEDSGRRYCTWKKNHKYYAGDIVYDGVYKTVATNIEDVLVYAYVCRHTHISSSSRTGDLSFEDTEYWEQDALVGINSVDNNRTDTHNVTGVYKCAPPEIGHSYDSQGPYCLGNNEGGSGTKYPIVYLDTDFIVPWHLYYKEKYKEWAENKNYSEQNKVQSTNSDGFVCLYECLKAHTSDSSTTPARRPDLWMRIPFGWDTIEDYNNARNSWLDRVADPENKKYISEWFYVEDYTRALRILGLDYLQNQQFDDLVLSITSDMVIVEEITDEEEGISDLTIYYMHIGDQIPVSASLFGDNLKPYPICQVSFNLLDDNQSQLMLGGRSSDLTTLIRNIKNI